MLKKELKRKLKNEKIPVDYYSLDGGFPNEAYSLNLSEDGWEVYYSERGNKTGLKVFTSEERACDYLFSILKDTPL